MLDPELSLEYRNVRGANWWWKVVPEESIQYSIDALKRGLFTTGPRVNELEDALAQAVGSHACTVTNSGTSALVTALLACGVGPGDEVVVPALTWIATAQAARILGARVLVVDVDYETMGLDPGALAAAITPATKAVISVFFNGHSPRMSEIEKIAQRSEIAVIEDRCKALGTTAKSASHGMHPRSPAAFSLGMISPVSIGYGGFLTSVDELESSLHKQLRDHGLQRSPDFYEYLSINFKASDVLASLGIHQLERLSSYISASEMQEQRYLNELAESEFGRVVQHQGLDVGTYCMFLSASADDSAEVLRRAHLNEVAIARYHPTLDEATYLETPAECTVAIDLSDRLLHLPCGPDMPEDHIARAIELLA